MDVGYQFKNSGELRLGYEGGWERFEPEIGNRSDLPTASGAYSQARLQYRLDRLDDAVIPRKGQAAQVNFEWSTANPTTSSHYPALEVMGQTYFKLSEPTSIFVRGYGGTTFDFDTGLPPSPWAARSGWWPTAPTNCWSTSTSCSR